MIIHPPFSTVASTNVSSLSYTGSFTFGQTHNLTTTVGSTTASSSTGTSGVAVGQTVSGSGVTTGSTVVAVLPATNQIVLSLPAATSATGTASFVMAANAVLASGSGLLARSFSLGIFAQGGGVLLAFQISHDNVNWQPVAAMSGGVSPGTAVTGISGTGIYYGSTFGAPYWRLVQTSAITSSTCTFGLAIFEEQTSLAPLSVFYQQVGPTYGYSASGTALNATVAAGTAVTTNSISNASRNVGVIHIYNQHNTAAYLKLWDSSTAITSSTSQVFGTAAKFIFGVSAGSGETISIPVGIRFSSGIQLFVGANNSLTDGTTLNTANVVSCQIVYI